MTTTSDPIQHATSLDPITLEVLRSRLDAVAEDAASTIARTGVSPVITESHDFGVALLDADGNLLAGAGWVANHWMASTRAVRATIARYGDEIAPGDVYLANDPYNGGGLHANDVVVERPIFAGGTRVAWVALSGHMMDVGGMVIGSFAPAATECYQEALRFPPVRLFKAGVEVSDVWDIFRTNVRMSVLIEMDLRCLVAGSYVAEQEIADLAHWLGVEQFVQGTTMLQKLSETVLRERIAAMPDGTYRIVTWAEWDDELFRIPCTLSIEGDHMVFDFEGASPQAPHYFNSQPYIIESSLIMALQPLLAPDLPYTQGLAEPIELRCPAGSIVNATPPAPMNMGHVHVALTAAEAMMQCVRLALWASDQSLPASPMVQGWNGSASMAVTNWSGVGSDQFRAAWSMLDGTGVGASAGVDHDGPDLGTVTVGLESPPAVADIEVLESWYPMLITERRIRPGVNGPGTYRSGGGCQVKMEPYETEQLEGQMLGIREWLPLDGAAGGFPGATTVFQIHRDDGTVARVSNKASDVILRQGETFEFQCPSGGGVGDPVGRDPQAVAGDVHAELLTSDEAAAVYGVVFLPDGKADFEATVVRRAEILADRLARAKPAARPLDDRELVASEQTEEFPLYPGIVHRGRVAYSAASGTALALAPDHWTDGCPVLEESPSGPGPQIVTRAYLDPRTGHSLYVEAVPVGEPRAFEVNPIRWTALGND